MIYYIIPLFIIIVFLFAIFNRVNAYNAFIDGAKEGIKLGINIFPLMMAMIFATTLFKNSNILYDLFSNKETWVPLELIIQGLFRPISGNAALGVMLDIYETYGVDSKISLASSILEGSSDTTLYVVALYFGSVGITKYRYAIKAGLISDFIGFLVTILMLKFLL